MCILTMNTVSSEFEWLALKLRNRRTDNRKHGCHKIAYHINTRCGQNAEFYDVKASGACKASRRYRLHE
jgi:hypothetical protein